MTLNGQRSRKRGISAATMSSPSSWGKKARRPSASPPEPLLLEVDLKLETEFRVLKSIIPAISGRPDLSELEIIDACVAYIESLQDQLRAHDPDLLRDLDDDAAQSNQDNSSASPPPSTPSTTSTSPPSTLFRRKSALRDTQRMR